MDVQATLKSLSLKEKVRLLSGTPDDFVSIAGISDKGIAPLKVSFMPFIIVLTTDRITRRPTLSAEYVPVNSTVHSQPHASPTQPA
jgi:hypothetical protein